MNWRRLSAVLIGAALLSGCSAVTRSDIDLAIKLCEPNGGLVQMDVSIMGDRSHQVTAVCTNGATVSQNNKGPR